MERRRRWLLATVTGLRGLQDQGGMESELGCLLACLLVSGVLPNLGSWKS